MNYHIFDVWGEKICSFRNKSDRDAMFEWVEGWYMSICQVFKTKKGKLIKAGIAAIKAMNKIKCKCGFKFSEPDEYKYFGSFLSDREIGFICPICERAYLNGREIKLAEKKKNEILKRSK